MSTDRYKPLFDRDFLRAELGYDYADYLASGEDETLLERLRGWSARELKRETQAEASFVQRFFIETWGYSDDGIGAEHFQLYPKFPIVGAGQTGNRGEADLAIGHFTGATGQVPQVVCEFKGIKADLDAPQNRKGNNRSPVMQARDYLWNARRGLFGNEPVQPRFAVVTDMDEFRLYWWDRFPDRYLRFAIRKTDLFVQKTLLDDGDDAKFDRFLFWLLFRPEMLLSTAGRPRLERLIEKQGKESKRLEGDFYKDYRTYREVLIANIMLQRDSAALTKGGAVRLAQKLLDRLIFVMFAEDMGTRVGFPVNALKEQLERFSGDKLLEAEGDEVWRRIKRIFVIMNEGGDLGEATIHNFNGGLFATDPAMDALDLPNRLFVRFGQARLPEQHKDTLLYLAATYNFASEGDEKNSIGLYTLGHIFEQSIVELEWLEARAEGRTSLTEVTKRKRDGVYYTPEWVVTRIIEETIDPLFAQWKAEAGWPDGGEPSARAAGVYWERLQRIKVIDPACGSGAFLIVALRHLQREFEAAADAAKTTGAIQSRPEAPVITKKILANNLYGVDINPASVEITQLSLWLHTAEAKEPLSSLSETIRCGNSLVDRRFYNQRRLDDDAEERDRINTFEWEGGFAPGSFDAVIGNPPYVKLQNFKKVNADMADWLVSGSTGEAPYRSTGTGNFDLYLPFIEKGLSLLNEGGRMGYIAPNLWPTLEYGEGLRGLIHEGRHLEKWLDFRSFQVFEEATVYTAIQIFSKAPTEAIRLAFAGDGDISRVDWADEDNVLPYDAIARPLKPWLIAPGSVREMIERLGTEATRLDDPANTRGIIVGIQTSADHIYHLKKLGHGRYSYTPNQGGKKLAPVAVDIEQAVMKPLVSGTEAKRFLEPQTDTHLLFPYEVKENGARLLTPEEMVRDFPKAWRYLKQFERELRDREGKKFDDERWYRMGRTQNLDKQEIPKLLVAQLVPNLRLSFDDKGAFYINNVRVNGILPREDNGWFLLGVLNAPVSNYIFKWLGKPKDNGYFEANKQFIAPLPIPRAKRADISGLSALAKGLQEKRTERVELRTALDERLAAASPTRWPLEAILPDVRSIAQIEETVPKSVPAAERKAWIDERREADEEAALARIDGAIRLDSRFTVELSRGKLSLLADRQELARAFVDEAEAPLAEAQWRAVAIAFQPSGKGDAKRLADRLRKVILSAPAAVAGQIVSLGGELAALSAEIDEQERQLHEVTAVLFKLTPEEERLVLQGRM
jgi:hypothetical protein